MIILSRRSFCLSPSIISNATVTSTGLSFTVIDFDDYLIGTPVDNIDLEQDILLDLESNYLINNDGV